MSEKKTIKYMLCGYEIDAGLLSILAGVYPEINRRYECSTNNHNNRKELLNKAIETVCNDRQDSYGEPEDSFKVIAEFWSTYLGVEVKTKDVAVMMGLLKIARIKTGAGKEDNWIDLMGYAACGGEIEERENSYEERKD